MVDAEHKETVLSFLYRKLHKNSPPPILLLLLVNNHCRKTDSEMVLGGGDSEYSVFEFEGTMLSVVWV